jgi:hypothetical protein
MANISPEPNTGCWLWTGSTRSTGYGAMSVNGRPESAHRIAWMLDHGPIPTGLIIRHTCDNGNIGCANPDHLLIGTVADNEMDKRLRLKTWNQIKTECPQGHPYAGDNLHITFSPVGLPCRRCRACDNARRDKYRGPLTPGQRRRKSATQRASRARLRALIPRPDAEPVATTTEKESTDE